MRTKNAARTANLEELGASAPRARRPRLGLAAVVLLSGVVAWTAPVVSAAAGSGVANVRILACDGATVYKPASFVISCADANAELTATRWTSWTASRAVGITRFGLNLCDPDCAASRITFFPGSTVRLSAPVTGKHGRLFSSLVVTYKLHGKRKTFPFSWTGDPSF